MDRLKLIYNPRSGNKSFKNSLDSYVKVLQNGGFDVSLFRTEKPGDIDAHLKEVGANYDYLLAAGGDGTVNSVVNAIMNHDLGATLGIIPAGTANDFASYLGLTEVTVNALLESFCERKTINTDIGLANDRYFINVCGGGLLPQVSQMVDPNLKGILGKMSYYITGISQIPNFHPLPIRIATAEGEIIEDDVYFFLVLNSPGAGSFDKIVKYAQITDNKLDFIAVKADALQNIGRLLVSIVKGEHLEDPNIIYKSSESFLIKILSDDPSCSLSDVDGEDGPNAPLDIKVVPNAIRLLTR